MGAGLSGKRVLVVEDEFFLADDLMQSLVSAGAQVIGPTPEQDDALELIDRETIDLAVIDINLRGKSGFEIADALVSRGIPFVFATGYDAGSIPERYMAVPRWEKPFNTKALVANLLGRKE